MGEVNVEDGSLSFFAALYQVDKNLELGTWLLFGTIVVLTIVAYKLGFSAKEKIPFFKTLVVYFFLLLGSGILTVLSIYLSIIEGLLVIVLVLLVYRVRRRNEKKKEITAGK